MQLQPTKKALKALSLLTSALAEDALTDKQRAHIAEVLEALAENPKSVSINRSQLELVWPDSERYLGADHGGRLAVLISPAFDRQKKKLQAMLVSCGIQPTRITILCSSERNVEAMLGSHHCRAVIFMNSIPKRLIDGLPVETSAPLKGLRSEQVRQAVDNLRKLLS